MEISDYLALRGESENELAQRADEMGHKLAQTTLNTIKTHPDSDPKISTVAKIVWASEAAPAPGGGVIHWTDLLPRRMRRRKNGRRA